MKIETKFNIGDRVWLVYERDEEVIVCSDYISEIIIAKEKNGNIDMQYWLKYSDYDDFEEDMLIPYKDTDMLLKKIKSYDDKIMYDQITSKGE